MLTDALIWLVNSLLAMAATFVETVIGWVPELPSLPSPGEYVASAQPVFEWVGWINYYLPVDVMLMVIGLKVVLWAAFEVFHAAVWMAQRARLIG